MFHKIPHDSKKGQELNIKLMLALISSSVPFNILDNAEWGVFVETLSDHRYKLPSREYMNGTIVPVVYAACKKAVIEKNTKPTSHCFDDRCLEIVRKAIIYNTNMSSHRSHWRITHFSFKHKCLS